MNLKKSGSRLAALLRYARDGPLPLDGDGKPHRPWDIIGYQDPPPRQQFPAGLYNYTWYPHSASSRVGFFVHASISKQLWDIVEHTGANQFLAATLGLETTAGRLRIHNIYSPEKKLDLDALREEFTLDGLEVAFGDWNLHDRSWCMKALDGNLQCAKATKLREMMQASGMTLLTEPYTVTFTRSESSTVPEDEVQDGSTIDLSWASKGLGSTIWSCGVVDVKEFRSDHRVMALDMVLQVAREDKILERWKSADRDTFRNAVLHELSTRFPDDLPTLDSDADREAFCVSIVESLRAATESAVPLVSITHKRHVWRPSPYLHRIIQSLRAARQSLAKDPTEARRKNERELLMKVERAFSFEKASSWQDGVTVRSKHPNGTWRLAKFSKTRDKPAPSRIISTLIGKDNTVHSTNEAISDHLRDITWDDTSPLPRNDFLPCPDDYGPGITPHPSLAEMKPGELSTLLKKLVKGKAPGADKVRNEALIMCRAEDNEPPVFEQHVEHLFNSCLKNSYYPKAFKIALIVWSLKDNKPPDDAANYRPIALASCFGKLYDKVIAGRLNELDATYKLLATTQFALAGRSTTTALQYMMNHAYTALSVSKRKLFVSFVGLDVKGAYNILQHKTLLEILKILKVPYWLLRLVRSHLVNRRAVNKFPGYESVESYVHVGVFQGSPLASILWAIFASEMLQFLKKYKSELVFATVSERDRKFCSFLAGMFADDLTVIVASPSYEENNRALRVIYYLILSLWATKNRIVFSSAKHWVLHHRMSERTQRCYDVPDIPGFEPGPSNTSSVKQEVKLLGVWIDEKFKWSAHVAQVRAEPFPFLLSVESVADIILNPDQVQGRCCSEGLQVLLDYDHRPGLGRHEAIASHQHHAYHSVRVPGVVQPLQGVQMGHDKRDMPGA